MQSDDRKDSRPMRILVTGGAGFIGSAVCRHLVSDLGHEVLDLDILTYAGNLSSLTAIEGLPNYSITRADVCDRMALTRLFARFCPDSVMHLVARIGQFDSCASAANADSYPVGFTTDRDDQMPAKKYIVALDASEREMQASASD